MDDAYKRACLILVGGISRALEQMEERNYGLAEKTLRDAWDKSMNPQLTDIRDDAPERLLLR